MKWAIFALIALAVVVAGKDTDKRGHRFQMRKAHGHFNEYPFLELYKIYKVAYFQSRGEKYVADDYRVSSPEGKECIRFLKDYLTNSYQIDEIHEFIVLDACLGYVFVETKYHDEDRADSDEVQNGLDELIQNEKLRQFFNGTRIGDGTTLDPESKFCIANLLASATKLRFERNHETCSDNWLQVFLNFAKCQNSISVELRESDTYLAEIYRLVKTKNSQCFNIEYQRINSAVRAKWDRALADKAKAKVYRYLGSKSAKQRVARMWPSQVTRLLKAFEGNTGPVNLRHVHKLLRGFKDDNFNFREVITQNMARYATDKCGKREKDDPVGSICYQNMVNDLCAFFRSSDDEKRFDFARSYIRLIKLLDYQDVFGIRDDDFHTKTIVDGEETVAMYMGTSACNIVSYTKGRVVKNKDDNAMVYDVSFKGDLSGIPDWPLAPYY